MTLKVRLGGCLTRSGNQQHMSFRQLLLQLGFLLPGSCIFMSRSESTVEMVQNILYAQICIWQIMSTHLICHRSKISMGELLHHTLNQCGDEGSGIFRGTQRERVRNSRTQLNILSTVYYVTQTKIHQSNNAFQHTHNPADEEGTQKLIKVIMYRQRQLITMLVVIQKTAHSYLFTVEPERKVM